MKTITVEVKKSHIKKGNRDSGNTCPIALAIAEQFPRSEPWIYPCSAQLVISSMRRNLPLPERAVRFVENFDQRLEVKPFSFRLRYDG